MNASLVGLVPAAGEATRLGRLPCSKELLPVGLGLVEGHLRPKPVCLALLEQMRDAGAEAAFLVIREEKWDIPRYLGDGTLLGMRLAYVLRGLPYGPPYSLDQAYPFLAGRPVLFGFPDILVQPADSYRRLRRQWERSQADVVLGLFPAHDPRVMDMVEADEDGHVTAFVIQPERTNLRYAWINALWAPAFTDFLHGFVGDRPRPERELTVGHVLQAALAKGLRAEAVRFPEGRYLDVGLPQQWRRAQHEAEAWGFE